ncbi:MAG: P13 family porin [Spirochaetia bacterium]|nr:P13 family porin [Spirochaetia bacterium]
MKIFIKVFIVIYAFYFTQTIFAEQDSDLKIEVDSLIKYGREHNKEQILRRSAKLKAIEKQEILENNKITSEVPIVANVFLRFGIGSYIQGDFIGGMIGTSGDLLAAGIIYIPLVSGYSFDAITKSLSIGIGVFVINTLFMVIKPILYANIKNQELSNMLFSDEKITFLFTPYQRPHDLLNKQEGGIISGIRFRF